MKRTVDDVEWWEARGTILDPGLGSRFWVRGKPTLDELDRRVWSEAQEDEEYDIDLFEVICK